MATVNLGAIKFNWKGAYAAGTAYVVDDVVESAGSSYVCILASTGNAPPNATYWELMAEGGDVATILTTQGDILYRDGSGLQRLGAGTSGQVLQTNGTGANPSWGTVSSDYVKLATVTPSGASSFSFQNYFTSDYDYYEIVGNNIFGNNNGTLRCRVEVGGTQDSGSSYDYSAIAPHVNSGGSNPSGGVGAWNSTDIRMSYNNFGNSIANSGYLTMQIFNPLSTTAYKNFNYQMRSGDTINGEIGTTYGGARYRSLDALSGLLFFSSGGTITGTFKLYGVK